MIAEFIAHALTCIHIFRNKKSSYVTPERDVNSMDRDDNAEEPEDSSMAREDNIEEPEDSSMAREDNIEVPENISLSSDQSAHEPQCNSIIINDSALEPGENSIFHTIPRDEFTQEPEANIALHDSIARDACSGESEDYMANHYCHNDEPGVVNNFLPEGGIPLDCLYNLSASFDPPVDDEYIPTSDQDERHVKEQIKIQNTSKAKKHACVYCERLYSKMARHLEQMHWNEPEVSKVLLLPKNSKERALHWRLLSNKGDYMHNTGVLKAKTGMVLPKYRMGLRENNVDSGDYLPCDYCLGMYKRKKLWKHQKNCIGTKSNKGRRCQARGRALLAVKSDQMSELILRMNDDTITNMVETDPIIREFGERLCEKHFDKRHLWSMISNKCRELGRLLMVANEVENITSIKKLLTPDCFDKLKKCVRILTGYDSETNRYLKPSLAMKLSGSLKKCAYILLGNGIKADDALNEQNARKFLELHATEFSLISAKAKQNLDTRKFNVAQPLPLFKDLSRLTSHINEKTKALNKMAPSVTTYVNLAKLNLAAIILFNRKRSGEVERIRKQTYQKGLSCDEEVDQDIIEGLTEVEKKLVRHTHRVELMGKRGRRVAILLTQDMVKNLNCMIQMREALTRCTNYEEEDYLFARPGNAEFPYRGHIALSELAREAACDRPDLITSTRLRKHLASMSVVLNIGEVLQDTVAEFMGHDIRVHRQFYRLPLNVVQKTKVAQILSAVNSGNLDQYRGKAIDDVDLIAKSKNYSLSQLHWQKFLRLYESINFVQNYNA